MKVSLKVIAPQGGYVEAYADDAARVKKTVKAAFKEAGNRIKTRGREAITSGGFTGRFANAFRVTAYPNAVSAFHRIPWAGQFEDPKPVIGQPYVWVPILDNLPGGNKQRWSPSLFTRMVGPLRGGRNGGRPILFGQVSVRGNKVLPLTRKGVRARPAAKVWAPVFIGVTQVNDPKRFDTGAVVERVGGELSEIYGNIWESNGG